MASIAKRPNGSWRARYRDAAGREHSRHFNRKVDAQRWLDETTASLVVGTYVDPATARTTVGEYAATWQAAQVVRPNTAANIDVVLRKHVLPTIGTRTLASVRPSDVQGLIKALSDTLAPGTVGQVVKTLRRLFAAAVDDRLIPSSPCAKIRAPRDPRPPMIVPTVEQVTTLAGAVPQRYRALVILLAGSGLRIGEALGLYVSDVDFLRRTVRVERQRVPDGSLAPPKTASSVRTVPLGQVVVGGLAAHLAELPEVKSSDPLFTSELGEPLTYRQWQPVWRAATRVALATGPVVPPVTTHDLRHFTASALIGGGASVKQVQSILGHSTAAQTLDTYSHLWPGDDDRTRAVMDAVLGAPADSLRTEEVVAE